MEHSTVVVDIFDDATNSFCRNSKPLSDDTSFVEGCLGENVFLRSVWDMMIVPRVAGWVSRGEIRDGNGWDPSYSQRVVLGYQGYKIKQPGYVDRESSIANCGNRRPANTGRDSTWAGGDAGEGQYGRETTSRSPAVQAPIGDVDLRPDCGLKNLCLYVTV